MKLNVLDIRDVAAAQLCCGCGACSYIAPQSIAMHDVLDHGRRPIVAEDCDAAALQDAMKVCPGIALEHTFDANAPGLIKELTPAWGPVLELWEGYASDPAIRFAGSSGGAASAIALYCIEQGGMHGVLHIAARADVPYLNRSAISTDREQLLAATGSRYAPASPCDRLQDVEDAPAPCVFIGKPCDVAGTVKAARVRPALAEKVGLTIGIFCAGTPTTRGTLEMLRQMGLDDPASVTSVRYRGMGWPGNAVATASALSGGDIRKEMTYARSWGDILQKHRQWRCHVCVDHSGEFADIAVGDPWHRPIPAGEPGRSLVVVRSERGRGVLMAAMAAGYLELERVEPHILQASQPGFPTVRGSVWGRIWTCRLLGVAAPRFVNMPMFRFWWFTLSLKQKLQSVYGTIKRVFRRGLLRRARLEVYEPPVRSPRRRVAEMVA